MACDRCRRTDRLSDAKVDVIVSYTGSNDGLSAVVADRMYLCHRCERTRARRWHKFKQERMEPKVGRDADDRGIENRMHLG